LDSSFAETMSGEGKVRNTGGSSLTGKEQTETCSKNRTKPGRLNFRMPGFYFNNFPENQPIEPILNPAKLFFHRSSLGTRIARNLAKRRGIFISTIF
jgi:hypothetical protein